MARRAKPWYRADRKAWFVTISGKRHKLGPIKKEAFERFRQLMRQPHEKQEEKIDPTLVAPLIDRFFDWVQAYRSPATYEWYRCRLQSFYKHHETLSVAALRPHHVEDWAGQGSRAVTTRRNLMRSVMRCLRWSVAHGYIDKNPIAGLEIPAGESRDVYVSPAKFSQLLTYVADANFADLLNVTYECGCRPQELLRVEARHVDLKRNRWVFPASESKTKRQPRVVYLSESAAATTGNLMACHPAGPLFRNTNGRPWTKDAVGCAFNRLQVRMGQAAMKLRTEAIDDRHVAERMPLLRQEKTVAGVRVRKTKAELRCEARCKLTRLKAREFAPRYSLYALRHSWATKALQNGVDSLTVAILMGHRDPSMLARTYQHLSHNPTHLLAEARRACS